MKQVDMFEAYRKNQNGKDMTSREVVECIFEWCGKYITIKNVMRVSGILLMISLFLASVTPTGYLFGLKYIDIVGNIIICGAWIVIKITWESEQKEKEREEEEYERRRNGIRY